MAFAKKSIIIAASIALVAVSVLGARVSARENVSPQRLIVTFDGAVTERSKAAVKSAGAAQIKELKLVNGLVVSAPTKAIENKLREIDGIRNVQVDAVAYTSAPSCSPWPSCRNETETVVAAPPQELPWGVNQIDAEKSWSISRGMGTKVAIIDTGIDQNHPDLIDNLAGGVNFVQSGRGAKVTVDPSAWDDDNGHGTHVAGTVAAVDNTAGVIGVAPDTSLYGVKVLNSAGSGYVSDIVSGIEWSINNNMQVINMSLGLTSHVQALQDAVNSADATGVVVIAAAGNSGDGSASTNEVNYPAKYTSTIAVAATDSSDRIASFSSDGSEVEIAAPGVDVLSTTLGGGYGTLSGTSMATPHVAGVAAAMLAAPIVPTADTNQDGRWSNNEIRAFMQVTSDDLGTVGRDVFYGYGLVDAEEAVTGAVRQ